MAADNAKASGSPSSADQGEKFFRGLLVLWDELTRAEVAAYKAALDTARDEGDMQRFLEAHPRLLIQQLTAGRRSWVIPKKRLGSEHETDFVIAQQASDGLIWYAVELERPQAKMFNKNGDPSAALTHALRQVNDWRDWLSRNLDYASRPRDRSGLNLIDIDPELEGMIIIGRDADLDRRATAPRRQRLERANRVKIETYDWLLAQASERLASLEKKARAIIDQNPLFGILERMARNPPLMSLPEKAIKDVFRCTNGWTGPSTVREEIEWEGVEIWPDPDDGDDNVVAPLKIVYTHGSQKDKVLQPGDWQEWLAYVTGTLDTSHSLLVTELAPDASLRQSLTLGSEGVWYVTEWFPWYNEQRLGSLHVLVHYPPSPGLHERLDITYDELRDRLVAACELFRRHIPAPTTEHEREAARQREVLSLELRDKVRHAKFGVGTVVTISRYNPETEVKVDFGKEHGVKNLVLRYAPLEKL